MTSRGSIVAVYYPDENGDEVAIYKQDVLNGLRLACAQSREARETVRLAVPIEEVRRAATAASNSAEAAAYWWDISHEWESAVVVDGDYDLCERADRMIAEVQGHLAAVLDVLAHVEATHAAQAAEDEGRSTDA